MTKCPRCGEPCRPEDTFCANCGLDFSLWKSNEYESEASSSGFGIASLVLGIIGICTFWFILGIPAAILGLIFGIIALVSPAHRRRSPGLAIAGVVTSGLALLSVVFTVLFFIQLFQFVFRFS